MTGYTASVWGQGEQGQAGGAVWDTDRMQVVGWESQAHLLHDSPDGCLLIFILITVWEAVVLKSHLNKGEIERREGVRDRHFT